MTLRNILPKAALKARKADDEPTQMSEEFCQKFIPRSIWHTCTNERATVTWMRWLAELDWLAGWLCGFGSGQPNCRSNQLQPPAPHLQAADRVDSRAVQRATETDDAARGRGAAARTECLLGLLSWLLDLVAPSRHGARTGCVPQFLEGNVLMIQSNQN